MSNIIDELITKFTLDDGPWKKGAHGVSEATQKMAEKIAEAGLKVKEFGAGIAEHLKFGELLAPLAAIGTTVGLLDLGKDAVRTAMSFDVLERKLAGVVGNLAEAKRISAFAESESSKNGLFSPEELLRASTELAAFGLNAKATLPTLEKLSAVFGDGGSSLTEFASAIGRINEGDPGRAMAILARAGIGRKDLMAQGVQFKGKEVTSSSQKVIQAIEVIAEMKYGPVMKEMINSPEARMRAFQNAWDVALRRIGVAIETVLMGPLGKVTDFLETMAESGVIDKITKSFTDMFSTGDLGDGLVRVLTYVVATIGKLPHIFQHLQTVADSVLEFIQGHIETIGIAIAVAFTMGPAIAGLQALVAAFTAVRAAIAAATLADIVFQSVLTWGAAVVAMGAIVYAAYKMYDALVKPHLDAAMGVIPGVQGVKNDIKGIGKDADTLYAEYLANQKKKKDEAASMAGDRPGAGLPGSNPVVPLLTNIEKNTKQSAMDLKKYAFGGGDLGRLGVSPVEAQSLRASRGGAIGNVVEALERYVGEEVNRRMGRAMKQGYSR